METNHLHSAAGKRSLSRPCLLMLLVLLCSLPGWAGPQESVKKKEIIKSFDVGKEDILQVDNRYGSIVVTHRKGNEVSIRVVIEAKAGSEKRAQEIIDRINIRMEKAGNRVNAVTSLEPYNGNGGSGESFTIDYYVDMPSELTCRLEQKYGNIVMPEENRGRCDLVVKYGNLNGGSFTGPLDIDVKYGNLDIADVETAKLNLAYCGKASLRNGAQLEVDSRYSKLNFGQVGQLTIQARYDDIRISRIEKGKMGMRYGKCTIEEVKQEIVVGELSYCTLTVKELDPRFESVDVSSRYGNVNLYIDKKASFRVVANGMKYGTCKVQGEFNVQRRYRDEESSGFDSRDDRREREHYTLDVNGGHNGCIRFDGNNYSNIKVMER